MPLHKLTDDERRSYCRREIEALELWLRRLVPETFSQVHGLGYLGAIGNDGSPLFAKKTVKAIEARRREDPMFERSSYQLKWTWEGNGTIRPDGTNCLILELDNSHVREKFHFHCQVVSNRDWHRFGHYDDWLWLTYKVLPPPA